LRKETVQAHKYCEVGVGLAAGTPYVSVLFPPPNPVPLAKQSFTHKGILKKRVDSLRR